MSKKKHNQERHLRVRGIRSERPDIHKIARVIIALAAQAEVDAEAEHRRRMKPRSEPEA